LIDRALVLNPNLAVAWFSSGWLRIWLGEPDKALEQFAHAERQSPFDSLIPSVHAGIAFAHFCAGDYAKASSLAEQVMPERPHFNWALRFSAASYALAGRLEDAHAAMAHLRKLDPHLRVSDLKELAPLRRPDDLARYEQGMRIAGLPE